MRIAQAIALYLPEFQGGATLVCDRLARSLAARGHQVEIFSGRTTADEPLGALKRDMVGPFLTWRVNLGGAFHPWSRENYVNPIAAESFAEFLAATRPDVVHAHSIQALGAGILHAARDAGIPVVLTMHDWWWLCPCLFRLSPAGSVCSPIVRPERCSGQDTDFAERRRVLDAALACVDRILTPSAFLREGLIANGFDASRIAVQENGTPPPAHGRDRARDAEDPSRPLRAVFLGGAGNREKGLGVLLDAACLLPPGIEVHAHAVSADDLAPYGDRLAGRVVAHPAFPAEQLDEVLADADVVVVPSLMRESFSLVVREALARGVPVVTSDCGGPEEVVRDGDNGLVIPTGIPSSLATALARLAQDRALLARLAGAARPRLATPDDQAAAAETLYEDVIRETRARREASGAVTPQKSLWRRLFDLRALLGLRSADEPSDEVAVAPPPETTTPALPRHAARPRRFGEGKRVLFLTGIDGAPLRYRVRHLAEQLAEAGIDSRTFFHSDERALVGARGADLIVLFRAPYSVTVAAVMAEARRRKLPVLFSVDDLVFRPELLDDAPALEHARPEIVAGFRQSVESYARSFAASDYFLGSTEALVDAARDAGRIAFLHRNGIGSEQIACAARARAALIAAQHSTNGNGNGNGAGRPLRIGFLSGTDTHDRDLAAIAAPLRRTLDRFPTARLVIGGPVAVPAVLDDLGERLERWPFVPWSELPARLASLDVNLAPLELPSAFNQAKSEVKYLEAGLVEVPTVASPSDAFRAATREGATGLLAPDEDAWERALAGLLADEHARATLARRARRDVCFRYGPRVQDAGLLAILDEVAERGPIAKGPPPSPIPMEAGGGSLVALEPAAAAYDAYQLDAESGAPLGPGAEVEQAFRCSGDGLRRVDVMVGTYARRNAHRVLLEVVDESGEVRGSREVPAVKLVDRGFVSVDLEAPADSAGRTFTVRASAPDAREGNEILLWTAPSTIDGLTVGGTPVPGRSITFRTFVRDVA
jgi:glycosyltransferase involved in cell wall biosynthesis